MSRPISEHAKRVLVETRKWRETPPWQIGLDHIELNEAWKRYRMYVRNGKPRVAEAWAKLIAKCLAERAWLQKRNYRV